MLQQEDTEYPNVFTYLLMASDELLFGYWSKQANRVSIWPKFLHVICDSWCFYAGDEHDAVKQLMFDSYSSPVTDSQLSQLLSAPVPHDSRTSSVASFITLQHARRVRFTLCKQIEILRLDAFKLIAGWFSLVGSNSVLF